MKWPFGLLASFFFGLLIFQVISSVSDENEPQAQATRVLLKTCKG